MCTVISTSASVKVTFCQDSAVLTRGRLQHTYSEASVTGRLCGTAHQRDLLLHAPHLSPRMTVPRVLGVGEMEGGADRGEIETLNVSPARGWMPEWESLLHLNSALCPQA